MKTIFLILALFPIFLGQAFPQEAKRPEKEPAGAVARVWQSHDQAGGEIIFTPSKPLKFSALQYGTGKPIATVTSDGVIEIKATAAEIAEEIERIRKVEGHVAAMQLFNLHMLHEIARLRESLSDPLHK